MRRLGAWTAIVVGIAVALAVAQRGHGAPPKACSPQLNAGFEQSLRARNPIVEGVSICGTVSGRPYESRGPHGLHAYIPVRVIAPSGVSYVTQVIPNEQLTGRISVHSGDAVAALGQFVYPNRHSGYDGLIHDTHNATHRGGVDGYLVVNGTVYR